MAVTIGFYGLATSDSIMPFDSFNDLDRKPKLGNPRLTRITIGGSKLGRSRVKEVRFAAHVVNGLDQQMRLLSDSSIVKVATVCRFGLTLGSGIRWSTR